MMFEIISIHYHKNTYYFIIKGEHMGENCLSIFSSDIDYDLDVACGDFYNIDYFLSHFRFLNRMYISDITTEEFILSSFYNRYLIL